MLLLTDRSALAGRQVLRGQFLYAFADHGGLIVAVRRYSEGGTRELLYSLDEGMTWGRHLFFTEDVKVYSLLTEPGEANTVFLIFCARMDRSGWISVRVDLRSQFRECSRFTGAGCGGLPVVETCPGNLPDGFLICIVKTGSMHDSLNGISTFVLVRVHAWCKLVCCVILFSIGTALFALSGRDRLSSASHALQAC